MAKWLSHTLIWKVLDLWVQFALSVKWNCVRDTLYCPGLSDESRTDFALRIKLFSWCDILPSYQADENAQKWVSKLQKVMVKFLGEFKTAFKSLYLYLVQTALHCAIVHYFIWNTEINLLFYAFNFGWYMYIIIILYIKRLKIDMFVAYFTLLVNRFFKDVT